MTATPQLKSIEKVIGYSSDSPVMSLENSASCPGHGMDPIELWPLHQLECLLIRYILMTRIQYKFIYIGSLGAPQVFQPGIFGMEISVKDPGDHLKNYIIQMENQLPTMTKMMTRTQ